jgi:hypothetical protein
MDKGQGDKVINLFEDSDYSRYPDLQCLDMGTMLAVGVLLTRNSVEITKENLLRAALAFHSYSMDEGTLVNSEDQHFMDLCDARRLDASTIRKIHDDLASSILHNYRRRGWYTVELTERSVEGFGFPSAWEGFYIFTNEAIQK